MVRERSSSQYVIKRVNASIEFQDVIFDLNDFGNLGECEVEVTKTH